MSLGVIVGETVIVISVIFPNTGFSISQILIKAAFLWRVRIGNQKITVTLKKRKRSVLLWLVPAKVAAGS